ncbi:MAG: acyl-CoA thioesterase [Desulfosarcina sp.]|nr:acyl-CoA thioesterase [Desulfosarcina sp.]MBC2765461.1 acyl-CoA thioesterase [Desulfosarcina sp.]
MKPKPFVPETLNGNPQYVKDRTSGVVWHRCETRTLYADTDRSQVVYHANYLRYFEFGRASLMRDAAYPYKEVEESGYVYPIIKVDIDYFRPLYYDDAMWVHTRPSVLERVRLQFDYIITHQESGDIVCKGFTRHCAVNVSGTPVEVDPKTVHLWDIFPKP